MKIFENLSSENLNGEIWKIIKDFPDYQISDFGRVKRIKISGPNTKVDKLLKQSHDKDGYLRISLYVNKKIYRRFVHRLVLKSFSPIDDMDIFQVNHINGIKADNRLENLEWCTQSENIKHSFYILKSRNQCGENNAFSKLKEGEIWLIKKILNSNIKISQKTIGKMFHVTQTLISQIKLGKIWKHI